MGSDRGCGQGDGGLVRRLGKYRELTNGIVYRGNKEEKADVRTFSGGSDSYSGIESHRKKDPIIGRLAEP